MPIVVHSPFIPGAEPDTRAYQFASDLNQGTQRVTDLLLQAILSGQLARTPTQGRYVSPSGQGTFLSPAEQVASNPTRTLSDLLASQRPPGSQFSRAGLPFRLQPALTRELQQAQLQQAQASIANAPLERKILEGKVTLNQAMSDHINRTVLDAPPGSSGSSSPMPTFSSSLVKGLSDSASSGDASALDKLRRLAIELDDDEAIAALQALGEL